MKKLLLGFAMIAVAATGIATAGTSSVKDRRAKALAAYQPVGKAVSCITSSQIRSTHVIDDRTIDFKMAGGKVYRNTLTHSCPSLGFEERFSYRTSTNQLCNVDIIRVLQSFGGGLQEGTGCGLGKFQPVEKVATK